MHATIVFIKKIKAKKKKSCGIPIPQVSLNFMLVLLNLLGKKKKRKTSGGGWGEQCYLSGLCFSSGNWNS